MENDEIIVISSWTIDFVSWECPKCGHINEITSAMDDDGICQECEFEIPNYYSRMNETDGVSDTYYLD